jgi:hypothetical protein
MARRSASVVTLASLLLLAVMATLRPHAAMAQANLPPYEVTGFRDARFGMAEPEVREIAKKSFGIDDGDMTSSTDRISGASRLLVHVPALDRGFGEGMVEYLFGYRQHKLFQVNVVWGQDGNPQFNNAALIAAALRLQRHFLGFAWAEQSVRIGVPLDGRTVELFTAEDRKKGAVALVVENVRYERLTNTAVNLIPEHMKATRLTISYTDLNGSDVREVGPGEF